MDPGGVTLNSLLVSTSGQARKVTWIKRLNGKGKGAQKLIPLRIHLMELER